MRGFAWPLTLILAAAAFPSAGIGAELEPRHVRAKPQQSRIGPDFRADLLIVKFRDEARVRLRSGRLVSLSGTALETANRLTVGAPGLTLERMLQRPEASVDRTRESAQIRSGQVMADLNGYYVIRLAEPDVARAEALLDALNALDSVEIAYAEPVPEPAVIVGSGGTVAPVGGTPDFTSLQDYHDPAPTGIDVAAAWALTGGRGEGVKIIDVELGFRWTHEDMPTPFFQGGGNNDSDHGLAVLGELAAPDNGFGVTGIVHAAQVGSIALAGTPSLPAALDLAATNVSEGDFVVIELQTGGPAPGGGTTVIPVEYYQGTFDVVQQNSANGIIYVAAAGNGSADLDDPVYEGLFDRNVRDSGAIMVGATDGAGLAPADFSNHGSRVDLSGWGEDVVTTGYGDLHGATPDEEYTADFGGTSSATPIVTGAVAALQGIYRDGSGGAPANGRALAEILIATGTPTAGPELIGPRPDLAQAIPALQAGLADLSGTVRDLGTSLPLEGALVRVLESGAQLLTEADGSWELGFAPGQWTIRITLFGYAPFEYAVNVAGGGSDDRTVDLTALPTSVVSGRVVDQAGIGLAGVEVRILDTPFPSVVTDGTGSYALAGVPVGFEGAAAATRSDLAPDQRAVSTVLGPASVDFRLVPPQQTFEADDGGFSPTGEWEWGIPTYSEGPAAHGGLRVWGVDLDDGYSSPPSVHSLVFTVEVPLNSPRLAYWHWHDVRELSDPIRVEVSNDGGAIYTNLPAAGGYPECSWNTFPCTPCWWGHSNGWVPGVHDLSDYAGQFVSLRFRLWPAFGPGAGWYIDDLAIFEDVDIVQSSVCVEVALDAPPAVDPHLSLRPVQGCPTGGVIAGSVDLISGELADLQILGGAVRLGPVEPVACADSSQAHLLTSLGPGPGEAVFFLAREVSQNPYGTSSSGLPRLSGPGACP